MPIVQSIGRLTRAVPQGREAFLRGVWPVSDDQLSYAEGTAAPETVGAGYVGTTGSYGTIYRTQPAVRTVVDFAARNVAQLGLHVFERVSDTDRVRDTTSPLAQLLAAPNKYTTPYRLHEHTLIDFGVFGNAYLLKLRDRAGAPPTELWRLPAGRVGVRGELFPTGYSFYSFDGTWFEIPASEVIHLRETNIDGDSPLGTSKIETLRRKLLAESFLQSYLVNYWRQGARIPGVIHRPLEAPDWDDNARSLFRQQFAEVYGGARGAGLVPVLDEGMTYQEAGHSAEEQQLAEARELHDEEVARAYHIPLPMVGLLRRATFSNIREQHKHLYQDALGPTIQMFEQEYERGLVREFAEPGTHYVEFNVREKLRGSFEEQVTAFQTAVGRPWMTVNEARAIQNMPRDPDPESDRIAAPLNMTTGDTTPDDVPDEASL
jgi:HK97 family phage portal protein